MPTPSIFSTTPHSIFRSGHTTFLFDEDNPVNTTITDSETMYPLPKTIIGKRSQSSRISQESSLRLPSNDLVQRRTYWRTLVWFRLFSTSLTSRRPCSRGSSLLSNRGTSIHQSTASEDSHLLELKRRNTSGREPKLGYTLKWILIFVVLALVFRRYTKRAQSAKGSRKDRTRWRGSGHSCYSRGHPPFNGESQETEGGSSLLRDWW